MSFNGSNGSGTKAAALPGRPAFGSRRIRENDASSTMSWRGLLPYYRWLLAVLPIYAYLVRGSSEVLLTLALGGAVLAYNGLVTYAEKRWGDRMASRSIYLIPIEIALVFIAVSAVHVDETGYWARLGAAAAASCFAGLALLANRSVVKAATRGRAGSLEELARQFRLLRDAVLILDDRGRITDANPAAAEIFQQRVRTLRGVELRELIQFNAGKSQPFDPVVTPGRARRPQLASGLRPSGEEFPVELTMSRYELAGGEASASGAAGAAGATVAIVRDLSDRQRIVEVATQRERLATIGEVLARVMHELATPLTGIATLVEDLIATASPMQRSELRMVREESERAGAIIHDVLAFVRRDTNSATVNVNEAVRRALKLTQLRNDGEAVQMELDLHPQPLHATATLGRLQQVVFNLLENARHAVEGRQDGKITVRTERIGESIRIEVIDNGTGIPEGLEDQIFEPFFTTKGPDRGTGLGLAIVEGIVSEFGGRVSVTSNGKGTTFALDLEASARGSVRQAVSKSLESIG